jgi:CTP synthase
LKISGVNPERDLVEIIEIEDHPWFVGVQFHPELRSTVYDPHALFTAFVKASVEKKKLSETSKAGSEASVN